MTAADGHLWRDLRQVISDALGWDRRRTFDRVEDAMDWLMDRRDGWPARFHLFTGWRK